MDMLAVGKFLLDTFGAIGGLFVFISGFLLRELISEYKDRRQDSVKMTEVVALSNSVMERVVNVLDKRS